MAVPTSSRLLAPLALAGAVLAVIVVVATSGVETPTDEPLRPTATTTRTTVPARPKARSYVVRPGDNLTVIADRTGVEIETIERLNPDLDPQALQTGERIKLAP